MRGKKQYCSPPPFFLNYVAISILSISQAYYKIYKLNKIWWLGYAALGCLLLMTTARNTDSTGFNIQSGIC